MEEYFDITTYDTTDYDTIFYQFSDYILNNTKLTINNKDYNIIEIEYYLRCPDHKDDYTHMTKDQLQNMKWYFHKYHNGTYKSGTYKGLDMTFGNKKDQYGGILIRSIYSKDSGLICGPCNCVNYILNQFDFTESRELVNIMKNLEINNNSNPIYLKEVTYNEQDLFCGPRVGLSLKYPEYLVKDYRYTTMVKEMKKYKDTLISNLHVQGYEDQDICDMTSMKLKDVQKYITDFNIGRELSNVDELDTKQINKLYGYYTKS